MIYEQNCPNCGSDNVVHSKHFGLMDCLDCEEIFEDEEEELEWQRESLSRKNNKKVKLDED